MLNLFVEPRLTLRVFLDDCRRARNTVLAGEPLSSAQLTLLSCQFQHIVRPVQRAYEQGRARINPAALMIVEEGQLAQFWEEARKRIVRREAIPRKLANPLNPCASVRCARRKNVNN